MLLRAQATPVNVDETITIEDWSEGRNVTVHVLDSQTETEGHLHAARDVMDSLFSPV